MDSISKLCVVLVVSAVLLRSAGAFKIKDCSKNSDARFLSLDIDACPDKGGSSCRFRRGTNTTLVMEFEPTQTFSQANIRVKGIIHFVPFPYPFPGPKDACNNYFNCPVKVGEKKQMKVTLQVKNSYPKIKAKVHFELRDENDRQIVCIEFPLQVV